MQDDQVFQSLEAIFQMIRNYHQLNFSVFLRQILAEKELAIPDLYRRLNDKGYCLSLESLYRYFSTNQRSHRFPSQDFIQVFAEVLQLTDEESKILLLFWKHWKVMKKCNCLY